ncbi:heme-binding protein [Kineobactrum salinum]|uniref:Heme-binding protein n=2 Tax=Kineobactrum salinum TaxID=2708301 RepID=A0A6C0U8D0_9GAMM|nr:heme-binding protein [Kineobactrum salinum]QIB67639.1 heme-binding protein [Kineobactrum salinum]
MIDAPQSIPQATVSSALARSLITAAIDYATTKGQPFVVAVADSSGVLKSYDRMDGAPLLSVDIAQNKAYTAAAFSIATHVWHDFIKDDAPLRMGIVHTPRLVTFGGGYPIKVNGTVVGGIGVSGGHYSDDMEIALAALQACGLPGD